MPAAAAHAASVHRSWTACIYIMAAQKPFMADAHDDYASVARRIIRDNRYMSLGTLGKDGSPWVAVVLYAFDDDYNFYFLSATDSQHGRNISKTRDVAFTIFDSAQPIGSSEGVQATGRASPLSGKELVKAIKQYEMAVFPKSGMPAGSRYNPSDYGDAAEFRFFKIETKELYVTGTEDRRTKVDLRKQ